MSNFERFKEDQVTDVMSVAEFLSRYYKPERYTGRGEEYATGLLASYQQEFLELGFCFISHHDSVTGKVVSFYPTSDAESSTRLGEYSL